MTDLAYFPGCSLKDFSRGFERSAKLVAEKLGANLVELNRWNCCGTVYSLAEDNLMRQLAPVRNLIRAQEEGHDELYALCSMCFNTLARANNLMKSDDEKLEKINSFMDQEPDYRCSVGVRHFIQFLRDTVGWEEVSSHVASPLEGLKVAPYYGCLMLRPAEIALDNPDDPQFLEDLIVALGGEPVSYPYATECCGAYNTVEYKSVVLDKVKVINGSALSQGADLLITACPLCQFNLDQRQRDLLDKQPVLKKLPALYFTQLMSVAYGEVDLCCFEDHKIDPRPVLAAEKIAVKR